jgi:hypothetical protein
LTSAAPPRSVSSQPLSLTITLGPPRSDTKRSSSRTTRTPPIEVSTTVARHSRLKSSTTQKMRKRRPSLRASDTKSSDHRRLIASGSANGARAGRPFAPTTPAHHQLFLAVDAIELLAVHHITFPGQKPAQASIAEASPLRGQLTQSLAHRRIVRPFRLIVQTRAVESHQPACAHPAHAVLRDESGDGCASRRRL